MTNALSVTNAEKYQKAALNTLNRQVKMGINIPKNFDAEGALGYTALKILDSKFEVSQEVIIDTLIKVASKGLDPRKDQIYILPNKKGQVMLMDSYFGYEKLAYDIPEVKKGSVHADVVHKGENVVFKGRTLEHEKTLDTLDNDIIGAYAKVIIDGEEIAQYMTAYQISLSWSKTNSLDFNAIEETRNGQWGEYKVKTADTSKIEKGKLTPFNKNQADFPEEMTKRTVVKNLLKPFIKSHAEPTVAASVSDNEETIIKEAEAIQDEFPLVEASEEQTDTPDSNNNVEENYQQQQQQEETAEEETYEELPLL
ncbi:RecT family recombinase [Lactococcus lactis]|uniref:RecT family recombinase n=1 Tax=Lactococcus lactis TaxID=1358 RepID=UPI00289279BE|nr:RecT family recombinase [Lactococcus lactis]MDT2970168.1 recombinase RecT [Lactococcus lactis]